MGKYDPLRRYLRRRRDDLVELTFADIELIIGAILPHAANKPGWWANEAKTGRGLVQCSAWLEAGFEVAELEAGKRVCFRRQVPSAPARGE